MIKQKGYNVFPDEVEDHIACLDGVASAEVVGMPHDIFDDALNRSVGAARSEYFLFKAQRP